MKGYIALVAVTLAAAIVMIASVFAIARLDARPTDNRPSCPQEDSCSIDYHDGYWFINGVQVTR